MAFNWINGSSNHVEVIWQKVSEEIQVNKDKELVSVKISCVTTDKIGYFDALSVKRKLTDAEIRGGNLTYIPIDYINVSSTYSAKIPIFAAVKDTIINDVYVMMHEFKSGDTSNPLILKIYKYIDGVSDKLLVTKTITQSIYAYTLYKFGPVDTDSNEIQNTKGLYLQISCAMSNTLPRSILVIDWIEA